jgi:predicted transcriptional regulator
MTVSATSLKLPRTLKSRIDKLARLSGESAHALMVRALADHVDAAERRRAFLEDAVRADEQMIKSGTGYAMEEVHAYLGAKVRGRPARRPRAVRWRR